LSSAGADAGRRAAHACGACRRRPRRGPARLAGGPTLPAVSPQPGLLAEAIREDYPATQSLGGRRRHAPCMAGRATMEESLDQADNPLAARTPRFGLREQGMHHLGPVHWNLTAPYLY